MNRYNPKKLLHSKWTAVSPVNKEKHFLVTRLDWDENHEQVMAVELEAVMTKKCYQLKPKDLQSADNWLQGWK